MLAKMEISLVKISGFNYIFMFYVRKTENSKSSCVWQPELKQAASCHLTSWIFGVIFFDCRKLENSLGRGLQFHGENLKNSVEECRCIKIFLFNTYIFYIKTTWTSKWVLKPITLLYWNTLFHTCTNFRYLIQKAGS